jgi:hypothetical protein
MAAAAAAAATEEDPFSNLMLSMECRRNG